MTLTVQGTTPESVRYAICGHMGIMSHGKKGLACQKICEHAFEFVTLHGNGYKAVGDAHCDHCELERFYDDLYCDVRVQMGYGWWQFFALKFLAEVLWMFAQWWWERNRGTSGLPAH